jgi:putative nucleotidyltransferase with HDIG domain
MKTASEPLVEADRRLFGQVEHHLMQDDSPSDAIQDLAETPAFAAYPFTMLLRLKTTGQSPKHHPEGSVWTHTLLVVNEAAKRRDRSADPLVFMWAALLHDIGKPDTTKNRNGKITATSTTRSARG